MRGARDMFDTQASAETQPVSNPNASSSVSVPTMSLQKQVLSIYRTEDGGCTYISKEGDPCQKKYTLPQYAARHWMEAHAMEELEEIEEKTLALEDAIIITTPKRMAMAKKYKIFCPFSSTGACKIRGRDSLVRPESFKRHMTRCAKVQAILLTKKQRQAWMKKNVACQGGNVLRRVAKTAGRPLFGKSVMRPSCKYNG